MANYRFRLAEQISETSCRPIKGMRFHKFENAQALGIRLSDIHRDTTYIIIDDETGAQYRIERTEKGGTKWLSAWTATGHNLSNWRYHLIALLIPALVVNGKVCATLTNAARKNIHWIYRPHDSGTLANTLNFSSTMTGCNTCKDCVFWIQSRCDGEATTCEHLETYDDWDREHANIGEL